MLIGNNISLVIYGIAMTKLLTPLFENYFFDTYVLLLIQTIISTLIILVTAEFLPKSIFKLFLIQHLDFFPFLFVVFIFCFIHLQCFF